MIKLFLQHTIGTKVFLYGSALLVLLAWFIYFHIVNYQFWLSSDTNVVTSVIILLLAEGVVIYLYEVFRDKRKPTIMQKTITKLPIYEDLRDRDKNIIDRMQQESKEEEKNAELEYFEKLEAKHEK